MESKDKLPTVGIVHYDAEGNAEPVGSWAYTSAVEKRIDKNGEEESVLSIRVLTKEQEAAYYEVGGVN